MYSLNRLNLIGRIAREPECNSLSTGGSVCNFVVATNQSYTNRKGEKVEETEFSHVCAFGRLAETCQIRLAVGTTVYVSGRVKTRTWTKGEEERVSYNVIAEEVIFL